MRTRLIIGFIVVTVRAVIPAAWLVNLVVPYYPALSHLTTMPGPLSRLLFARVRGPMGTIDHPTHQGALVFCLVVGGLLLAVITRPGVCRFPRVRLARAAQRMPSGDLSVRIGSQGRDELAQLVTTFNAMAAALEDKIGELARMEARARQFAGDGDPPVCVRVGIQPDAPGGQQVALEVRDHGPGLPPAVIPHVSERFYKAGTAREPLGGQRPGGGDRLGERACTAAGSMWATIQTAARCSPCACP